MYKQVLHHLCQPFFLAIPRKFEGIHPFLSAYPSRRPSGYPTVIKHGLLDLSTIGRSLIPWKITVKIHHWLFQLQTSTPKGRRFPSHVWWTFSPVSTATRPRKPRSTATWCWIGSPPCSSRGWRTCSLSVHRALGDIHGLMIHIHITQHIFVYNDGYIMLYIHVVIGYT